MRETQIALASKSVMAAETLLFGAPDESDGVYEKMLESLQKKEHKLCMAAQMGEALLAKLQNTEKRMEDLKEENCLLTKRLTASSSRKSMQRYMSAGESSLQDGGMVDDDRRQIVGTQSHSIEANHAALREELELLKLKNRELVELNKSLKDSNEEMKARNKDASEDPMAFHFHMLLQGAKVMLATNAGKEGFAMDCFNGLRSSDMYAKLQESSPAVPFYEWNNWIKESLSKMYVEHLYERSLKINPVSEAARQSNVLRNQGLITEEEHRRVMEADKQFRVAALLADAPLAYMKQQADVHSQEVAREKMKEAKAQNLSYYSSLRRTTNKGKAVY